MWRRKEFCGAAAPLENVAGMSVRSIIAATPPAPRPTPSTGITVEIHSSTLRTGGERVLVSQGVMASRKGYTSLPVDSETNKADAEQSGGREHTPAGAGDGSVGAKGDAASGRDATSGSGTEKEASATAEKAGGSAGKDAAADLTGAEREPANTRHFLSVVCCMPTSFGETD